MRRGVVCILVFASVAAAPITRPATAPSPAEAARQAALGEDWDTSRRGIADLAAMGEAQKPLLLATLREVLLADKLRVQKAGPLVDEQKSKALEGQIDEVRKAAWPNLQKLAKNDTLTAAQLHYDKLMALMKRLNAGYAARMTLIEAMGRRAELLAMYRKLAGPADTAFLEGDETNLAETAAKALGAGPEEAAKALPPATETPPDDPAQRGLWLYRFSRRVEAYNATLHGIVSKKEAQDIADVNAYREALGILPLESDPRLVQSARLHSKEMLDLDYFSHDSPTPGLRRPADRMRAAGYAPGFLENIARDVRNPETVFKLWFNSPGHHQTWLDPECSAIGAGKWDRAWTQNFGHAPRLMDADPSQREKLFAAAAGGQTLAPEPDNADAGKPDRRTITETIIIDPFNPDPAKRRVVERKEEK